MRMAARRARHFGGGDFFVIRIVHHAHAARAQQKIGSLAAGMEADLVVLDMRSTPLIDARMNGARDFAEQLFIQMTLGDDRAVQATYIAGRLAYAKTPGVV